MDTEKLHSAAVGSINGARLTEDEIQLLGDASVDELLDCGLTMDDITKALSHAGIENNRRINQKLYDGEAVEESISSKRLQEIIKEELAAHRNMDYESPNESAFVKNQLYNIARNAMQLHEALANDDDIPTWCISYVSQVSEKLNTVTEYLEYKVLQSELEID